MIAEMREALQAVLGDVSEPVLLAGGASKEAWSVDAGGERLLVRRAAGVHRPCLLRRAAREQVRLAVQRRSQSGLECLAHLCDHRCR